MARVLLENVSKVFEGGVVAVAGFNLDIEDREFIVLVGPSGCGKSTTLRMIAGLEEVTEGRILIGDRLVNDVPPKDRDIAMVFQNYALYPHMSVYENMAFGLRLRKCDKGEIGQRVRDAAEILGISELLDRRPKALSGGQRQRVAVGRAIVRKPKVFLFDEPLSNLDAKLRVQTRTEIKKLHGQLKATMVYVTHDQVEAMTMGSRIVVMKDGVVQQIADPITLYQSPVNLFVAGFIGSPAMNFFEGRLSEQDGTFVFSGPDVELRIPDDRADTLRPGIGREVVMGIRPEDVYDACRTEDVGAPAGITGILEVVEPIGNEMFLYFNVGGRDLVARVGVRVPPQVNNSVDLVLDMARSHFFDRQTGASILGGREG